MIRSLWLWPTIIFFSAVAVAAATFGNVSSPLRPLVTFWFLLVCPGMAFVRLLKLREGFAEWTLAVALSLALDALVAITLLYAGMWSPYWGLVLLIGITLVGVVIQVIVADRRAAADTKTATEDSGASGKAAAPIKSRHFGGAAAVGLVFLAILLWARSSLSQGQVNAGRPQAIVPGQSTTVPAEPTTTSTPTSSPSPVPTATLTPVLETPTALQVSTSTLSPTASRTPPATPTIPPLPTPCIVSPPSTWVQYTVKSSDTLSELAIAKGTTAVEAGRVNCLENIRLIRVGQVLWLPPLAATETPVPTNTPLPSPAATEEAPPPRSTEPLPTATQVSPTEEPPTPTPPPP